MVWLLTSHQCGLGSIPGPCVICGLSLCWFSTLLREVFHRALRFSPLLKNQHFQIPIWSWNARTFLLEFLWTPWCSVGKQITFFFYYLDLSVQLVKSLLPGFFSNKSSLSLMLHWGKLALSWSSSGAEHDPGRASNSKSAVKLHAYPKEARSSNAARRKTTRGFPWSRDTRL